MKFLAVVAILSLFSVCLVAAEEDHVIVLTKDNFQETLASNDALLVEFYAPWCGHCKNLEPHYKKAAGILHPEGINIAKVDATIETELAQQHGIQGYPTIKFFKKGKVAGDYEGERTTEGIVSFMRKKSGPASVHIADKAAYDDWNTKEGAKIVGFFADQSADLKVFTDLADDPATEDFLFAYITDADLAKELGATAIPEVVVTAAGAEPARYTESLETEALLSFILSNAYPLTEELSQQVFRRASKAQRPLVVLFTNAGVTATVNEQLEILNKLANAQKGSAMFSHIAHDRFNNLATQWGASGNKWPALVTVLWVNGQAKIKVFDETADLTLDAASAWTKGCIAGTGCPSFRKSEEIPTNDGPVKVVVGKNFEDLVLDASKNVLVEFYAPWCGHCKKLAPIYDQLGERFAKVPEIVVAKSDATANGYPDSVDVQGFPTLIFWPAGDKTAPITFDGERTLEGLSSFLEKHVQFDKSLLTEVEDNKDEL